ncbi:MAG TPA: hypothetical protein VJ984_06945 [Xanthomonadales bacterium]|nr:hypothetical protein [Xanthomonadales bacterium]
MLNHNLNTDQALEMDIQDCGTRVCDTGITPEDSANLGPKRLAKQRLQRARRRNNHSLFTTRASSGWMTRML